MNTLSLVFVAALAAVFCAACIAYLLIRSKGAEVWLPDYLKTARRNAAARKACEGSTIHVLFCFVDHFEPMWRRPDYKTECERVARWTEGYPALVRNHVDSDGKHPQHTFFYPEEEYRKEHIDQLVDLCASGYGEIEVHIHHENDTEESLSRKLSQFIELMNNEHQALPIDPESGVPSWGFIHGNWALCNSHPEGKHCGVNDELQVLRRLGCYVDMTMPSAPNLSQAKTVNKMYYATSSPDAPRSHDHGVEIEVGKPPSGDLLLIPGPLGPSRAMKRGGLIPKIENADVRLGMEPTPARIDQWIDTHIHVPGRPEWVFVKVHTHGTQERDQEVLLGSTADRMYRYLEEKYNDGSAYCLHYVSAREMYNIAKAAEAGESGNPNQYRDYIVSKAPAFSAKPELDCRQHG